MLRKCRAWVICASIVLTYFLGAQEQSTHDPHGDSLPAGAIGRLGQLAFRVAAPVEAVTYLGAGSIFLVKTRDRDYRVDACFHAGDYTGTFTSIANVVISHRFNLTVLIHTVASARCPNAVNKTETALNRFPSQPDAPRQSGR